MDHAKCELKTRRDHKILEILENKLGKEVSERGVLRSKHHL